MRFPEFTGEWKVYKLKNVLTRYINKVDVISNEEYYQIGIRSHGKGIFYKDKVTGEELGNKKIFWLKDNLFIVNIVFAWEQAVAKTTKNEIGWVASHRFPMYESLNGKIDIDFITYYFKTKKGKYLLELASPGGAGRNKTLGQTEFENLDLTLPQQAEQERISSLLSLIDERIVTQNKIIEDLKLLKSAIRDKLYSTLHNSKCLSLEIKDILDYEQPTKYIVDKDEYYSDSTLTPVLTANKAFILGYTNENTGIYNKGECIIFDDFTMDSKFVDFSFKVKSSAIKILRAKDSFDTYFIFEYITYLRLSSEEHKRHYISEIEPRYLDIPDYRTQLKIASTLRCIDKKLTNANRINELYLTQKQYLLSNIFI